MRKSTMTHGSIRFLLCMLVMCSCKHVINKRVTAWPNVVTFPDVETFSEQ